jgi:hypothetical protein
MWCLLSLLRLLLFFLSDPTPSSCGDSEVQHLPLSEPSLLHWAIAPMRVEGF